MPNLADLQTGEHKPRKGLCLTGQLTNPDCSGCDYCDPVCEQCGESVDDCECEE